MHGVVGNLFLSWGIKFLEFALLFVFVDKNTASLRKNRKQSVFFAYRERQKHLIFLCWERDCKRTSSGQIIQQCRLPLKKQEHFMQRVPKKYILVLTLWGAVAVKCMATHSASHILPPTHFSRRLLCRNHTLHTKVPAGLSEAVSHLVCDDRINQG